MYKFKDHLYVEFFICCYLTHHRTVVVLGSRSSCSFFVLPCSRASFFHYHRCPAASHSQVTSTELVLPLESRVVSYHQTQVQFIMKPLRVICTDRNRHKNISTQCLTYDVQEYVMWWFLSPLSQLQTHS